MKYKEAKTILEIQLTNMHGEYADIEMPKVIKDIYDAMELAIEALDEVEKHKETFEWCRDCKEYDQKEHCCHRWIKRIRDTLDEQK